MGLYRLFFFMLDITPFDRIKRKVFAGGRTRRRFSGGAKTHHALHHLAAPLAAPADGRALRVGKSTLPVENPVPLGHQKISPVLETQCLKVRRIKTAVFIRRTFKHWVSRTGLIFWCPRGTGFSTGRVLFPTRRARPSAGAASGAAR